jgi:hypothetical protein
LQTVMTRRARATLSCRHLAGPDPTEWDSMVADTSISLGLRWLACGWAKERVGWFHGITGEQGEARHKRSVIGYSVWGSWQAGSGTGVTSCKCPVAGLGKAGLEVAFCTGV